MATLGESATVLSELAVRTRCASFATGLESAAVFVDGNRYLADRLNYLATSCDRLPPGAWMAT